MPSPHAARRVSPEGHQHVLPEVPHYRVRHDDLRGAVPEAEARALDATRGDMSPPGAGDRPVAAVRAPTLVRARLTGMRH
ncbi:hypothetical protein, partial [Streptomyces xantholiticus]|uniref:hypothetical protein n=1 Tax=Streptomyces xantholiticus TaxID=68285 RepID=UPI001E3D6704